MTEDRATYNTDSDIVLLASDTMKGDLITALVDELKAAPNVWAKLSQVQQDEVIFRFERRVGAAIREAVRMIASDNRPSIEATLEQITAKDGIKAVITLSKNHSQRHDLLDAVGQAVLIVVADAEPYSGGDKPKAEPDQKPLLAGGVSGSELGDQADPLLPEAEKAVRESNKASISGLQRVLKIGYNRAARLIESLEAAGVVSAPNAAGERDVLAATETAQDAAGDAEAGDAQADAEETRDEAAEALDAGIEAADEGEVAEQATEDLPEDPEAPAVYVRNDGTVLDAILLIDEEWTGFGDDDEANLARIAEWSDEDCQLVEEFCQAVAVNPDDIPLRPEVIGGPLPGQLYDGRNGDELAEG